MKIKRNESNNNLWCVYSKEQIEIGEIYIEVVEKYFNERIVKNYKYEYADLLAEEFDEFLEEEDI